MPQTTSRFNAHQRQKKHGTAKRFIDNNAYRLPLSIKPVSYKLYFEMPKLENPGKDKYKGQVDIALDAEYPTNEIILNAKGIDFNKATLHTKGSAKNKVEAKNIKTDRKKETATLVFPQELSGQLVLSIDFERNFNPPNEMRGLYESTYTLPGGKKRVMATTQFESASAREAFPCFDDPVQKATFEATLTVPEDREVITTTKEKRQKKLGNGLKQITFEKTPKMSPYLLAFIVGDFEFLKAKTKDGTQVRFCATPGKLPQGEFALNTAVKTLEYFNDYFKFPYKKINSKLDIIAVPDFEAGAMENIGAATFRESVLLVGKNQTSTMRRRFVAEVIAHEIAHMWKGDLVTPFWWDNLWLKESFATFMSYKAVDNLFPEWNSWDDYLASITSKGKDLASLKSAHPIEVPVKSPDDIDQIYDAISYNMGGSVLRMLEQWLGEDVFRDGIRLYVSRHAFGNTRTEDLWQALKEASGKNVVKVMNTWVKQTGYPVVHIEGTKKGLLLRQERFFINRDPGKKRTDPTLWNIPVSIKKKNGKEVNLILKDRRHVLKNVKEEDVAMVNSGYSGFYRLNPSPRLRQSLSEKIKDKTLPVADRLGLAEDAYALVRAGYISLPDYLEFIENYKEEDNNYVWESICRDLITIADIFKDDKHIKEFRAWARNLLAPITEEVGWAAKKQESEDTSLLRKTVLHASAHFGNTSVIKEAKHLFENSDESLQKIHHDLRGVVLGAVAKNGNKETFERFIELHKKALKKENKLGPEAPLRFLSPLPLFKNKTLARKALDYSLSENVRPQNVMYVWRNIPSENKGVAWEYLKKNWEPINQRFGHNRSIADFVVGATSQTSSDKFADEVEKFFKENPAPRASEPLKHTLENIRARSRFLERNQKALAEFFKK